MLDFVAANAPTVGEGLRRIARYFALVDPRGSLTITDAEPMRVGMESTQGAVPAAAQEYTFAALVLRSRAASGVGWTPAAGETYRVTIHYTSVGDIVYETTLVSC